MAHPLVASSQPALSRMLIKAAPARKALPQRTFLKTITFDSLEWFAPNGKSLGSNPKGKAFRLAVGVVKGKRVLLTHYGLGINLPSMAASFDAVICCYPAAAKAHYPTMPIMFKGVVGQIYFKQVGMTLNLSY
jgi:hypothetical protein